MGVRVGDVTTHNPFVDPFAYQNQSSIRDKELDVCILLHMLRDLQIPYLQIINSQPSYLNGEYQAGKTSIYAQIKKLVQLNCHPFIPYPKIGYCLKD